MTAFDAYVMFLALRQHFTSDYDYIKYKGKLKADPSKFEVRKDKYTFQKLAKRKDLEEFIIANLLERDISWAGDLSGDEAEKAYTEFLKRRESLTYRFEQELGEFDDDFEKNFAVVDGQHPLLIKKFRQKKMSIETLIILDDVFKCFKRWNKKIQDPVVWPNIYRKCLKYRPFLRYDRKKFISIMKKKFDAYQQT